MGVGEAGARGQERCHAHGSPIKQADAAPGPNRGRCCGLGIIFARLNRAANAEKDSFLANLQENMAVLVPVSDFKTKDVLTLIIFFKRWNLAVGATQA